MKIKITLLILLALFFTGCSLSGYNANKIFSKAYKLENANKYAEAYDEYLKIFNEYPGSNAVFHAASRLQKLKPLVFRFGIRADYKTYPQNSPEDTLKSFLKAFENKDYEYAAAYLVSLPELNNEAAFRYLVEQMQKNIDDSFFIKFRQSVLWAVNNDAEKKYDKRGLRYYVPQGRDVKLIHLSGLWYITN